MGCIYGIRNEVNQKWYIGKCADGIVRRRKSAHYGGYGNDLVYKAIKKYGAENFSFHILLDGVIPELLADYEIEYIKKYDSKAPRGYNLTDGGEGRLGNSQKHSEATKRKISQSHKGKKMSEEAIRKTSEANKGRKHSQETRRRISEGLKGRTVSKETRRKLSEAHKGRKASPEARKNMSEARRGEKNNRYGTKHSKETRRKMSEAAKNRKKKASNPQ